MCNLTSIEVPMKTENHELMKAENYEPIRITGIIVDRVSDPQSGANLYEIPLRLSRTPDPDWVHHFLQAWDMPQHFASSHRPAMEVGSDSIILDGTTIDELEQFHLQALKLAAEEANRLASEEKGKLRQTANAEEQKKIEHREHVSAVAKRLRFD
jgi:hypothetical protein